MLERSFGCGDGRLLIDIASHDATVPAPLSRRMRVSLRVSMSAMPTTPASRRYPSSDCSARKLDTTAGRSRTHEARGKYLARFDVLAADAKPMCRVGQR